MKLYKKISHTLRMINSATPVRDHTFTTLKDIEKAHFPHRSGFDGNCFISQENSTENKITIIFEWQCETLKGDKDGWLTFALYITPDLSHDFNLKINWHKHNYHCKSRVAKYKPILEEYFYEVWTDILSKEIYE